MKIDQIYQDGRHYDLLFPANAQEIQFWLERAHEYGDPILELACGSGRIAIPLAQHGHAVTGIDIAEPMLFEASCKAAAQHVDVRWVQEDIRNFDLGETFHLILFAANALCHLHTLADFEQCMACVKRQLRPAGHFIVEVFVPNLELLLRKPETRYPFGVYHDPSGAGQVVVTHTSRYDPATQMKYNTTYSKFPGQAEEIIGTLNMRMYFPQELDALFQYNGFVIKHKYGATDLRPFDASATMQIFVLAHG